MSCFNVHKYKLDKYTSVDWQVYGYTGHYSIEISAYNGCSSSRKYRLPAEVDVGSLKEVRAIIKDKYDNGYYFPNIKGFVVTCGEKKLSIGTKNSPKITEKPLSYENLGFYRHIDVLLSLAKKLNVNTNIDHRDVEFSIDKVYKLAEELDATLSDEFKLFKLMEGKGIADILNDLSKTKDSLNEANIKVIDQAKQLVFVKDCLAYNISLVKAKEQTEQELREEIKRLTDERENYKNEIITRIKASVSNL